MYFTKKKIYIYIYMDFLANPIHSNTPRYELVLYGISLSLNFSLPLVCALLENLPHLFFTCETLTQISIPCTCLFETSVCIITWSSALHLHSTYNNVLTMYMPMGLWRWFTHSSIYGASICGRHWTSQKDDKSTGPTLLESLGRHRKPVTLS